MSYELLLKRLAELRAATRPGTSAHEIATVAEAAVALADAADAHCALQDTATDKRVGLTQPITVAEGEALNEARDTAFAALDALAKALL